MHKAPLFVLLEQEQVKASVQQWTSVLIFELGKAEPKTIIIIVIVGRVVVAISGAAILRIVVPRAAAKNTTYLNDAVPFSLYRSDTFSKSVTSCTASFEWREVRVE